MNLNLSIVPHPARVNVKGADGLPLLGDDGKPIMYCPIKDQQSVALDGAIIAYCGVEPGKPLFFLPYCDKAIRDEVAAFVEREVGKPSDCKAPPTVVEETDNEYDDEYDEG